MNYIDQIKGFWRSHDVETYPTNVIALYFYLLEVNNKTSWSVSFKRNNSKICADLGISYPTLNNSRNRLKQSGIIDFKTQNGNANVTYTLKKFLKVTDEVTNEVTDEVTNEVGSRLFKSKDKLKLKRKLKHNSSVANAPEKKEPTKFWSSFVDIWFRRYDEVTGAKPTFNPAAAKNLKSIILRLEKLYFEKNSHDWEEVKALIAFNRFLDNALKDDWLKSNFLLTNLSTQFDKIVNQPRDGKSNYNNGKNNGTSYVAASIDTDSFVQELTKDLADGNIPGQY